MTLKQLASEICKREGKLSEVSVGNVREIIGIISDIIFEDSVFDPHSFDETWNALYVNGKRRAKKKID